MSEMRLSVIVVSRHRPEALKLCLTSLAQQDHPFMEVIVVADPKGLAAAKSTGYVLKLVGFDEANISRARNLGLRDASGDVVAFIDDDAVAEPTWASRLAAPFIDDTVVASTGFVRGRNGISYQWKAAEVDETGRDYPLPIDEDTPVSFPETRENRAIKTVGTNCAFRRQTLIEIGGFDEDFHFYLDETDVNLRLRGFGRTAVVPMAQVMHGYLASRHRAANRVPQSLFDIGASTAAFLLRHAPDRLKEVQARLVQEQMGRLRKHVLRLRLSPFRAKALMEELSRGWAVGLTRQPAIMAQLDPTPGTEFLPLQGTGPRTGYFLFGWSKDSINLRSLAADAVNEKKTVTILCLSFGFRRHKQSFEKEGFWLQVGGVWGKSDRMAVLPFGARSGERIALIKEWCSKRRRCE